MIHLKVKQIRYKDRHGCNTQKPPKTKTKNPKPSYPTAYLTDEEIEAHDVQGFD